MAAGLPVTYLFIEVLMGNLLGLLVTMFFMVLGVAFIGGCLFILLDVVLQPTDSDESDRRF